MDPTGRWSGMRSPALCIWHTLAVCLFCMLLGTQMTKAESCALANEDILHQNWTEQLRNECTKFGIGLENVAPFLQMQQKKGALLPQRECHCQGDDCSEYSSCYNRLGGQCPDLNNINVTADVRLRSLCPWFYEVTEDTDRYPQELVSAQCCYTHCANVVGLPNPSQCGRITYNVPVLYKNGQVASDGTCIYEKRLESISVGCTCAPSGSGSTS